MVRKCCVFNCNGNYNDENRVKVFRLPTDAEEKSRWIKAIPRDNIPNSKDTVVCERHWPEHYPTVSTFGGKSRPANPPTIFECVSSSLIPTQTPVPRTTTRTCAEERNQLEEELSAFNDADRIPSFEDLQHCADSSKSAYLYCSELCVYHTDFMVVFQAKELLDNTGIPIFLPKTHNDLSFAAFHCGAKCSIATLSANRCLKLRRWSENAEALRYLRCMELNHQKEVIIQQICSMNSVGSVERKYSTAATIRSFEYFSLSRSCYKRLRRDFELPSIKTLSRLTSIVKNSDDVTFLQNIICGLSDRQKSLVLLIDEVYVKPTLQYHGGTLFGKASNKPSLLANMLLTFMVVCITLWRA